MCVIPKLPSSGKSIFFIDKNEKYQVRYLNNKANFDVKTYVKIRINFEFH